jgi:hypothetical protein
VPPSFLEGRLGDLTLTIEFGIISAYRSNSEMTDRDAMVAVELLLETFQTQMEARDHDLPIPEGIAGEVYSMVKGLCEWRMGAGTLIDENDHPIENTLEKVSASDVISCLRTVHRSIAFWSNENGTFREYLTFTSRFIT